MSESSTENSSSSKENKSSNETKTIVYGDIPAIPVMEAVDGIKFDFNNGVRVYLPDKGKEYIVVFSDLDTGVVLYNNTVKPGSVLTSIKKFYIRFRIVIREKETGKTVFTHDMDLTDKEVMIQFPVKTLGDSIAWFSYVERFQKKHKCKIICVLNPIISELFRKQYPNIVFIDRSETMKYKPYASYYIGLFFKGNVDNQPVDFRYAGLHKTAGYILGLEGKDLEDLPPRFDLSAPRQIKEKYVCIAAQSSSKAKLWNNPFGWTEVVEFLKNNGYRVLCIDKDKICGRDLHWNYIPYGSENFTGELPLQERINLIKDADFFIGLSSGLSWLAWGCNVPIVMISGFTHPENEFYTPYRVINYHACNSCWNDMRVEFDHHDFMWCPRHKDDNRQFECSRLITPIQVIETIKRVPTFKSL